MSPVNTESVFKGRPNFSEDSHFPKLLDRFPDLLPKVGRGTWLPSCKLDRVQTLIKNKWHRGNLKLMCEFAHLKFTTNLGEFSEQNNGRDLSDTSLGEISRGNLEKWLYFPLAC